MTAAPATENPAGLRQLVRQFASQGRLEAILLRPARDAPMRPVEVAEALAGQGLVGDRAVKPSTSGAAGPRATGGKRQVTLVGKLLGRQDRDLARARQAVVFQRAFLQLVFQDPHTIAAANYRCTAGHNRPIYNSAFLACSESKSIIKI